MIDWTQDKITEWAQAEFSQPDFFATAKRMKKEIDEFYKAIDENKLDEARKEIVDIEVMLRQCAELLGLELDEGVNEKMDINVQRVWEKGEDGDFQHVDS